MKKMIKKILTNFDNESYKFNRSSNEIPYKKKIPDEILDELTEVYAFVIQKLYKFMF